MNLSVKAGRGWLGRVRFGIAWHSTAGRGEARLGRRGELRHVKAELGMAGLVWQCVVRPVEVRPGRTTKERRENNGS